MDRIATWSAEERETLFEDVSERLPHLLPALIEKDFWVCWLLRRLFLLDQEVPMIFKGDTSISKAYPVIRRFSEDIDISLDRASLGYGDDRWDSGTGTKAFRRLLADLGETCDAYVHGPLFEALTSDIEAILGTTEESKAARGWRLERKVDGPDDGASLLFAYPRTTVTLQIGSYVAPNVLLEFGARADHWPAEERHVAPYAAQAFPELFTVGVFPVRTLNVTRTFWEKAACCVARGRSCNRPGGSPGGGGDPQGAVLRQQLGLIQDGPARFASARSPPDVQKKVEADYQAMAALFMGKPPSFSELIELLAQLEESINR
ncbi:MAG: nucleotidyl transferase AbiEii/AbiGii toxin family protein [Longimicrobiales bacterium]|nr:nucleotidyl transferase AbiEii/AbiGii toxin family protein [Longimicrobiales bacterium]